MSISSLKGNHPNIHLLVTCFRMAGTDLLSIEQNRVFEVLCKIQPTYTSNAINL